MKKDHMRKILLNIAAMMVVVNFYSCLSIQKNDFYKIRYLEKHLSKKGHTIKNAEESNNSASENVTGVLQQDDVAATIRKSHLSEPGLKNKTLMMKETGKRDEFLISDKTANLINPEDIIVYHKKKDAKRSRYNFLIKKGNEVVQINKYLIPKILLCFLLPPLAVYWHRGVSDYFWVSLIVLFVAYPMAIIYSLLVVMNIIVYKKKSEAIIL